MWLARHLHDQSQLRILWQGIVTTNQHSVLRLVTLREGHHYSNGLAVMCLDPHGWDCGLHGREGYTHHIDRGLGTQPEYALRWIDRMLERERPYGRVDEGLLQINHCDGQGGEIRGRVPAAQHE